MKPADSYSGSRSERLVALDALRGLALSFLALDICSVFIAKVHPSEYWELPLPIYPDAFSFLTRLITHPADPGLFLLLGLSVPFFEARRRGMGWSETRIAANLAIRGCLLIALQHMIINPAWLLAAFATKTHLEKYGGIGPPGGGSPPLLAFALLSGLGGVLIICAATARLDARVLALMGIAAVLLPQILIPRFDSNTLYSPILRLLLVPGHTGVWLVSYPVIPWLGVALFGLILGRVLLKTPGIISRSIFISGAACILLFLIVRLAGGFGNLHLPREDTWIEFLNMTKFPPSLAFLTLMVGVNLIMLALSLGQTARVSTFVIPLVAFGRVPLLCYVAVTYTYAIMAFAIPGQVPLPLMYSLWTLGLLITYPLCRWYGCRKYSSSSIESLRQR